VTDGRFGPERQAARKSRYPAGDTQAFDALMSRDIGIKPRRRQNVGYRG
jgi:hypothetical protein